VLHLLAISREMGVQLDIDDFQKVSERTPLLADLKPRENLSRSTYTTPEVSPVIAKRLLDGKAVDGSTMTITGKTLQRKLRS